MHIGDTNVVVGLVVLAALFFLFLIRRGFRGMTVAIGE